MQPKSDLNPTMSYRTPTDKVDSSSTLFDTPKIIISKPSSISLTQDDLMAIIPRKFKMVFLKEMIRMPAQIKDYTTPSEKEEDSGDKKALSASRLENICSTDNSQSDMKEEPLANLSTKKRKCESLVSSPAKKDSLKKVKVTQNRSKIFNDIQKLLKEEKELEKEIITRKNENSSEKDQQKYEGKIEELDELSSKWKEVSQNALYELHKLMDQKYGNSEVTLSRIILELGLKSDRLDWNEELEDFESS